MEMYEKRLPTGEGGSRELDQGDVLSSVLLPKLPHERTLGFQRQASSNKKDGFKWHWKEDFTAKELREQEGKELRVMSRLGREPFALVLGNSCDNFSGEGPILLAPIRPFEHHDSAAVSMRKAFADLVDAIVPLCKEGACGKVALLRRDDTAQPVCEECAPNVGGARFMENAEKLKETLRHLATEAEQAKERAAEQWMTISRSATGANPKRFYMPGDPAHSFARSEAHLILAQPVPSSYLTRCLKELGASRVFGLGGEAVRHLQYTIESFFGRNPRDDHAWPAREDLELKAVWLESELARPHLDDVLRTDYVKELAYVRSVLA